MTILVFLLITSNTNTIVMVAITSRFSHTGPAKRIIIIITTITMIMIIIMIILIIVIMIMIIVSVQRPIHSFCRMILRRVLHVPFPKRS